MTFEGEKGDWCGMIRLIVCVDCFHAFDLLAISSDGPPSLVEFCAKMIQNAKPPKCPEKGSI